MTRLNLRHKGKNIGAEYLAAHGGAYTLNGYVKHREFSREQAVNDRPVLITIHLRTLGPTETTVSPYRLTLPATDEELDRAKTTLDIDYFPQANVVKIEFGIPSLQDLIPQDGFCVEDANELALSIEEMLKTDGELLKYLAVLSVMQPETLTDALRLAMNLDDYERITENTCEYGTQALRRIGADDEILDTIDSYMDLEKFGEDSMVEDGVRQTEYGLIRHCLYPRATSWPTSSGQQNKKRRGFSRMGTMTPFPGHGS